MTRTGQLLFYCHEFGGYRGTGKRGSRLQRAEVTLRGETLFSASVIVTHKDHSRAAGSRNSFLENIKLTYLLGSTKKEIILKMCSMYGRAQPH